MLVRTFYVKAYIFIAYTYFFITFTTYDAIPVLKENPTNENKRRTKILVSTVVKLAILRIRVDRNEGSVLVLWTLWTYVKAYIFIAYTYFFITFTTYII
jgi:hypothetical protein